MIIERLGMVDPQIKFEYRDLSKKQQCEYCGNEIFDFEDPEGPTYEDCPHILYIYVSGDPDSFIYARKDYAERIIHKLLQSNNYKSQLADEDIEPFTTQEIAKFQDGEYEILDDIPIKVAFALGGLPEEVFPELLPPETIVYKDDQYYSLLRMAVTKT